MKTEQFVAVINALPTLKEKRAFYLTDVAEHFKSENRAVSQTGACLYSPLEASEGCGIGRRIEDKDLCAAFDCLNASAVYSEKVFPNLPDWMKELKVDFLSEVQKFHDTSENWDNKGLSESGIVKFTEIQEEFKLY